MSKYNTIYRVVENTSCNDHNSELPYTILTYDLSTKINHIRRKGFNSWHEYKNDGYYFRTQAEKRLVELCTQCNYSDDESIIYFKQRVFEGLQQQLGLPEDFAKVCVNSQDKENK